VSVSGNCFLLVVGCRLSSFDYRFASRLSGYGVDCWLCLSVVVVSVVECVSVVGCRLLVVSVGSNCL
jgi:hypothetical protein